MGASGETVRDAGTERPSVASWVARAVMYVIGIAVLALGVSFSRRAGLGLSMLVAWPAVMADIDPSEAHNMGWYVGAVFVLYVLLEILVLRRDFKPLQLLQVPISLMYGSLVNLWNGVSSAIPVPNYLAQVALTLLSVLTMAVGVSTYLTADVVPLSSEGIVLAAAKVSGRPFPKIKQAFDLTLIALALVTSLIGLHEVRYVREGTVLAALCLGPLIGVTGRFVGPVVRRICFGSSDKEGSSLA